MNVQISSWIVSVMITLGAASARADIDAIEIDPPIPMAGEAVTITSEDHVFGQVSYTQKTIEFLDGPTEVTGVHLSDVPTSGLTLILADGEWIKVEDGQMDQVVVASSVTIFKVDPAPMMSNPIPEPSAALLFAVGMTAVAALRRTER